MFVCEDGLEVLEPNFHAPTSVKVYLLDVSIKVVVAVIHRLEDISFNPLAVLIVYQSGEELCLLVESKSHLNWKCVGKIRGLDS